MNTPEQQPGHRQKKFQMMVDYLRETGFTGNVPFTSSYRSLSPDEKKKFLNESKTVFGHIFNIAPDVVPELFRFLDAAKADTSDDENDANVETSDGH